VAKPTIKIADAMAGGLRHIGYDRDDLPMFHSIVAAPPGSAFTVDEHFAQCKVCRRHRVTQTDFFNFMRNAN
jgi:hypothetical protein